MKTKKINYLFFAIAISMTLGSCDKDFIELKPEGQFLTENYYADKDQAFAGLVATYDVLRKNSGGFENMITMMNAGSDDFYGGGDGATSDGIQVFSNYTINPITMPESFWSDHYQGIFRANVLIQKLPEVPMDDNLKARFNAEAKALRALYYFNLVRMFKNIPLITAPLTATEIYNVPQVSSQTVYAQIEIDLLEAINVLPSTVSSAELGRFSKGAAQALLGKVYLYENKNALAAAQFADVNGIPGGTSQYGYHLLPAFSSLWIVANKFNTESILEVNHSSLGDSYWGIWGSGADEGNTMNQMIGPRNYVKTGALAPNIPSGWSFNPMTVDLYNAIKLDPRFGATVLDVKALKLAGQCNYIPGYQDTGYFLNKFIPRQTDVYTGTGNSELNFKQNTYIIRLADTYLMEAEALGGTGARAQALFDAVRARVGLPSTTVTLAKILDERRLELAGEGHRFFDLVRTGQAASKLAVKGFVAGKNEILPIPYRELQNTLIVQNPNYN
ncbi:RagB/SusD family nutrient uptake outer membrane protein [Flavobacterium sp.]|uniref:RagB/SusD family nutrient uptake outer membrane protein n=1 Tax=Flavobacterium sp. TaxID=239 RepID=UPI003750F579